MARTEVAALSGNPFVDAIINNGRHYVNEPGVEGPFNINYFFDERLGYDWRPYEQQQFADAIDNWADVAQVTFSEVGTAAEALFRESLQDQRQSETGGSTTVSASHSLPSANPDAQSIGTYNFEAVNTRQWSPDQFEPGGNFYRTFMHEIGHGLGLKHPHDQGGSVLFPGIDPAQPSAERQRDLGILDLNHMFGSVMSYAHGYEFAADGSIVEVPTRQRPVADDFFLDHGFAATPMAYDIAAVQYLYGANMAHAAGDNLYTLPDSNDPRPFVRDTAENEAGVSEKIQYLPDTAFWACIWDAGGTDEMRYDGAANAILDLTAATLDSSATSRGVLSHAAFIGGGYTIANGVVIENATGGSGNDAVTGNAAANYLQGRAGNDVMAGGGGNDTIDGGEGIDTARYEVAANEVFLRVLADGAIEVSRATPGGLEADRLTGIERIAFADVVLDLSTGRTAPVAATSGDWAI